MYCATFDVFLYFVMSAYATKPKIFERLKVAQFKPLANVQKRGLGVEAPKNPRPIARPLEAII